MQGEYKMARHFPSLRESIDPKVHTSMFIQDVALPVVPTRVFVGDKECEIEMTGAEENVAKAINLLSEFSSESNGGVQSVVAGAINDIASNLAWSGEIFYELVDRGDGGIVPNQFTSQRLFRSPWFVFQAIPKADRDLWGKKYGFLWSNQVWSVAIPDALGGHSEYARVLRRLARYDSMGPDFFRAEIEKGEIDKEFNFDEYSANVDIYVNLATKKWGWNRRDSSQRRTTEYYYVYRTAQFHRAKAVLREHILGELNKLLKKLKIDCKVSIKGVVSSEEIAANIEALEAGEIGFEEVAQLLA